MCRGFITIPRTSTASIVANSQGISITVILKFILNRESVFGSITTFVTMLGDKNDLKCKDIW
jgi:hypothetical protein